jgi:hypothetical protein
MKASDYREKSEEMGRLAEQAETPEQVRGYRELQQAWLDMAAIAEQVEARAGGEDGP